MAVASITLEGWQKLDAKLVALEKKVGEKIVRTAVREALTIYKNQAKMNAKTMIGHRRGLGGRAMRQKIASALTVEAPKKRKRGGYTLLAQIKRSRVAEFIYYTKGYHKQISGRRYFIPAAIEYGHGRHKRQAARPFARTAWQQVYRLVLWKLTQELREGIERVARTG